jgi:hypothetical protein
MSLRAFALMLVLGLHSSASAAAGLFHLCRGEAQLKASCCCPTVTGAQGGQNVTAEAAPGACCDEPEVRHAPAAPASLDADKRWTAVPLLALPVARSHALQPLLDTFAVKWVRARGVSRATAPPLYIQHCSYLV